MARKQIIEPALVLTGVAIPTPKRVVLRVAAIRHTQRNPRGVAGGGAEDLKGLIASLASTPEPDLAQPPAVEQVGPDAYVVLYGDRRIRAVEQAGWQTVACDVYPPLDPLAAHDRRLLENMNRVDIHPLDEADAIGIAWLSDNAGAMNLHAAAREILTVEQPAAATIAQLTALLTASGWSRSRPKVTQMATLERLGLTMNKASLKKLMRLLSLSEAVKATARQTELTAAGLRALGTLAEEDQVTLVTTIKGDPSLTSRVRRIARKVTTRGYPLERALSEARGQVWMGPQSGVAAANGDAELSDDDAELADDGGVELDPAPTSGSAQGGGAVANGSGGDRKAQSDAAMKLLDVAGGLTEAITMLKGALGGQPISSLAPPWDEIVRESLDLIQQEAATLDVPVA